MLHTVLFGAPSVRARSLSVRPSGLRETISTMSTARVTARFTSVSDPSRRPLLEERAHALLAVLAEYEDRQEFGRVIESLPDLHVPDRVKRAASHREGEGTLGR